MSRGETCLPVLSACACVRARQNKKLTADEVVARHLEVMGTKEARAAVYAAGWSAGQ